MYQLMQGYLLIFIAAREERIIGGTTASTVPAVVYQVAITDSSITNKCTGALIHPNWVITSASCAARFR